MDGEDPNHETAEKTQGFTSYDVGLINDFKNLHIIVIKGAPLLNGRYRPFHFQISGSYASATSSSNQTFPTFRLRVVFACAFVRFKWGLDIQASNNRGLSGNLQSLHVLKSTLCELMIRLCDGIDGDFMQLADFPQLEKVGLGDAKNVTGDALQINPLMHFPNLQILELPDIMYLLYSCKTCESNPTLK